MNPSRLTARYCVYSFYPSNLSKKISLIFLFIVIKFFAFAGDGKLDFRSGKLESGTAGANGSIYRFPKVDNDIDALIQIKGRSDALVYLATMDMVSSGFDKAWQPQVGYNNGSAPGPADWWMEFEITFVKKGTNTVITVDEFNCSAIDIDGNGHLIREYVAFSGLNSYILEAKSVLAVSNATSLVNGVVTNTGKRFDGPTINFLNIDTSGTTVMVTTKYTDTKKFTIRTGGVSSGANGASDRMYSLYFQGFKYNQPSQIILPVNLKSFMAATSASKININWTALNESTLSHYTLEKSMNGKIFQEVSMNFANGEAGKQSYYTYSEQMDHTNTGVLYFRLKMIDVDGTFKYSDIRIVRLNAVDAGITVSAYPNPVRSVLHLSVPTEWQDKKIIFTIYNSKGNLVKQMIRNQVNQTETLLLDEMVPGSYIVRLFNGEQTVSRLILKSL